MEEILFKLNKLKWAWEKDLYLCSYSANKATSTEKTGGKV